MKKIDLETWPRAAHYHFFKRMDYPHYNICANIDITNFLAKTREQGFPFYYSMIFAVMSVLNSIDEFKYRIRGEEVVLHDIVHPVFSDMPKDSDNFKMVYTQMSEDIEAFATAARSKSQSQTASFVKEDLECIDDLVYITTVPWISFTNISHTISFNKDDSVPRLAWGKYFSDGDKIMMPFSVQAHHSFVDGVHMGRLFEALQEYLYTF